MKKNDIRLLMHGFPYE